MQFQNKLQSQGKNRTLLSRRTVDTGHHRGKLKQSRRKAECGFLSSCKASIAKNQHDRNPVIIFFQVTQKSLTKKKAICCGGSVI